MQLVLVGVIQYGLMYIAYNYAFHLLQAYEVALFTILTPVYVTLIHDALERKIHRVSLLAAVLAVTAAAVIQHDSAMKPGWLAGFIVVQASNLCFAAGQLAYREIMKNLAQPALTDQKVFGLLYLGGFLSAAVAAVFTTPWGQFSIHPDQVLALLYLGCIASGLGFFLWNAGARRVDAGMLAVLNNLKIPLAVAVSLIVFGENADPTSLLFGSFLILCALFINQWKIKLEITKSAPTK